MHKIYFTTVKNVCWHSLLVSGAGEIYEPKRNRLSGENADMLLFLKYNLPLFDFKYE